MELWIHHLRKDGKYKVTYGFDNGAKLRKIIDHAATLEAIKKAEKVFYHGPLKIKEEK